MYLNYESSYTHKDIVFIWAEMLWSQINNNSEQLIWEEDHFLYRQREYYKVSESQRR